MSEENLTVWDWLGITKEEFEKNVKPGFCINCGKPTGDKYSNLCKGHKIAYHRWRNQKKQNKPIPEMVEEISEAEFVAAYMDTHSGKTGETLSSNAKRLFKCLQMFKGKRLH